jgi:hypothetical protein
MIHVKFVAVLGDDSYQRVSCTTASLLTRITPFQNSTENLIPAFPSRNKQLR